MPFICWCYTAFATILVWGSVFGTFGFDDIENNSFISVTKFGVITHMYQSSHMVRRINTQLSIITWSTVASLHYVSEMQSLKKIGSESCIYGQKGTLIKKIKGQAFLNAISVTCPLTLKDILIMWTIWYPSDSLSITDLSCLEFSVCPLSLVSKLKESNSERNATSDPWS